MRIGTCYFVTQAAATRYFAVYGFTACETDRKIEVGDIKIGKPPLKTGDKLTIIDDGTRYAIEDAD